MDATRMSKLVIVRHGERVDETCQREQWRRLKQKGYRRYDPPISSQGCFQAQRAAAMLLESYQKDLIIESIDQPTNQQGSKQAGELTDSGSPSSMVVYVSPFVRCLQTANIICNELQKAGWLIHVKPIKALGECAAVMHREGVDYLPVADDDEIRRHFTYVTNIDPLQRGETRFLDQVQKLMRAHVQQTVVAVCHREGFRDLRVEAQQAGQTVNMATPKFCAVGEFYFNHDTDSWSEGIEVYPIQEAHQGEQVHIDYNFEY